MAKKLFFIIIIIMFINSFPFLHAEENINPAETQSAVQGKKEKVFIYDFEDQNEENNYAYLSPIIAGSISADLNRTGNFESRPLFLKTQYPDSDASEEELNNYINDLAAKAEDLKSEFLLTGAYIVDGLQITISCMLFDAARKKLITIDDTGNKISAVLVEMIEEVSDKVNKELLKASKINEENRIKEEEERKNRISPFIGFYNSLSGFTFGFNYGRAVFMLDWADIYNNADTTSLYLSYQLNNINSLKNSAFFRNAGFTGRYDHLSVRSDSYKTRDQILNLSAGSLNMNYHFRFNSFFNIALSAGGGVAYIETEIEPERDEDGNITALGSSAREYCPFYTSSLSLNIYFSSLKIESGFSYNVAQHSYETMHYSVIYFGLGYRL